MAPSPAGPGRSRKTLDRLRRVLDVRQKAIAKVFTLEPEAATDGVALLEGRPVS